MSAADRPAPLSATASVVHNGAGAVGQLITGDGTNSIQFEVADGFGTLGPWAVGDRIEVAWEATPARPAGYGVGIATRFAPLAHGVLGVYFVWSDDDQALAGEIQKARELVKLWADARSDALAGAVRLEGSVVNVARRRGVTTAAVYKAMNRRRGG